MPARAIYLALNCGSSSLKFGVYEPHGRNFDLLLDGEAEEIGSSHSQFWTRAGSGAKRENAEAIADHAAAFDLAWRALTDAGLNDMTAVGHRVVHGGPKLRDHQRLDKERLEELRKAVPFAPLHLPPALAVIDAVLSRLPNVPQVLCLDTAMHKDMPDVAKTLPFSEEVRGLGVERFGFHGLSVESIVEQLDEVPARMVVAHLGNGSSITALRDGKSIDTTMGLTPTGGVMMGTRTGDVDPGVMVYLMRQGWDAERLESEVDHEAGLKGISELTSDVRQLSDKRRSDAKCDLALRMFAYQVKKQIAGMAAALGGLDLLVFTGGIGEHAAPLRDEICRGLEFIGDFEAQVIPAEEDLQIARITERLMAG